MHFDNEKQQKNEVLQRFILSFGGKFHPLLLLEDGARELIDQFTADIIGTAEVVFGCKKYKKHPWN